MQYMFNGASSFNQDLHYWNVFNVISCGGFWAGSSLFLEARPIFTKCNPG